MTSDGPDECAREGSIEIAHRQLTTDSDVRADPPIDSFQRPRTCRGFAGDYVALVYGRQLQQKATREERDALKRRLVAEHPDAARQLGLVS